MIHVAAVGGLAKPAVSRDFTVYGIPAPQGSKTPWGSEANPNTRPWRATVAAAALDAFGPVSANGLHGPVILQVTKETQTWRRQYGSSETCPRCGGDAGLNWFDRSFCPCEDDDMYPGVMHTRCDNCGYALDGCAFERDTKEETP